MAQYGNLGALGAYLSMEDRKRAQDAQGLQQVIGLGSLANNVLRGEQQMQLMQQELVLKKLKEDRDRKQAIQEEARLAELMKWFRGGGSAPGGSNVERALAEGAAQGSVGPTVENAARLAQLQQAPPQAQALQTPQETPGMLGLTNRQVLAGGALKFFDPRVAHQMNDPGDVEWVNLGNRMFPVRKRSGQNAAGLSPLQMGMTPKQEFDAKVDKAKLAHEGIAFPTPTATSPGQPPGQPPAPVPSSDVRGDFSAVPSGLRAIIEDSAKKFGVDANDLMLLAQAESSFNPNAVNRRDANGGSYGLFQINKPHLDRLMLPPDRALDPTVNSELGARIWSDALKTASGDKNKAYTIWRGATTPEMRQKVAAESPFRQSASDSSPPGPPSPAPMPVAAGKPRILGLIHTVPPKERQKLELEQPGAQQAMRIVNARLGQMEDVATDLLNNPALPKVFGLQGIVFDIPGGPAADARALLIELGNKLSVAALQAMRDASKTGGAVGQVTEKEWDRLRDSIVSLKQTQSLDQGRKQLQKIVKIAQETMKNVEEAYTMTYGSTQEIMIPRAVSPANVPAAAPANAPKTIDFREWTRGR